MLSLLQPDAEDSLIESKPNNLQIALSSLAISLPKLWEDAFNTLVRKSVGIGRPQKNTAFVQIELEPVVQQVLSLSLEHLKVGMDSLRKRIDRANLFVDATTEITPDNLVSTDYGNYCSIRETANRAPEIVKTLGDPRVLSIKRHALNSGTGSIMITGSAGYGKTSFCKFQAALDAEAIIDKKSTTLPVYVKLHHLGAQTAIGTAEDEFFPTSELRSLTARGNDLAKSRIKEIRLYLDGLDEVPSTEKQRQIMRLAKEVIASDSRVRAVLTSRDYVNGPWLDWMPRVSISPLDETQIRELVLVLLGKDTGKVERFFVDLEKVPSLKPLMTVPLLATLTLKIYKRGSTLPENRIKLYEMFMNLLCGGWDHAKSVSRDAQFGVLGKLSVLTRLAAAMHLNKWRDCNAAAIRRAIDLSNPAYTNRCDDLLAEFLRDGMLTRSGAKFTFCHLSFQEYLASKELDDPSGKTQKRVLREYLRGDEWWYQPLSFYVSRIGMPQNTENWLLDNLKAVETSLGPDGGVVGRCNRLINCINEAAPGFLPKSQTSREN